MYGNHVAAAMFRIEAAVRLGLTNPACTSTANQWLPNRKDVEPKKLKDCNFSRGKKKRSLVATPKTNYNPLVDTTYKPLKLVDIAEALAKIAPNSILHTAVPKPKIDFVCEVISKPTPSIDILSIDDVLIMSKNKADFLKNVKESMTVKIIKTIEEITKGQNTNQNWYHHRKGVITASKAHDVSTKMKKIANNISVSTWALDQKISGLVFVSPDIPALKYGRSMEESAANVFFDELKTKHKDLQLKECGLFLQHGAPYIGGSPDRIVICSCCKPACLEIKCPFFHKLYITGGP